MKIFNSLTQKYEEFIPREKGKVGMYVCGPTVYDDPHIGHARSAYFFDMVRRYLQYKGHSVTFVRNVTDVDDKIIQKARELNGNDPGGIGRGVSEVAARYLGAYHKAMGRLGIGRPDIEPKATDYIPKMRKFIELLIERGAAYASGSDVYFSVRQVSDYGKLSNQSIDKMETPARAARDEKKRDPLDFALWKSAKENEPSWESPWGMGRPGWHIECSSMSSDLLGDEFDIHGGGIDLIFPHHENERAQSLAAGKRFARYWIHNGLVTIRGEKMAKSLGNFITIESFLSRYRDPDFIKLFFLSAHYRTPVDYTDEKIEEAKKEKERFRILLGKIEKITGEPACDGPALPAVHDKVFYYKEKFDSFMDDDLNTPSAIAVLFDLVSFANRIIHETSALPGPGEKELLRNSRDTIVALSRVLGLDLTRDIAAGAIDKGEIDRLISERDNCRISRDFGKADEIRGRLLSMGIIVEDTKDGSSWRLKN